ncbi:MAG: hypothetical protein EXS59_00775 [Candidatus Taylorbacteria bacterium]|nr:hypothetical protein [Candidatus Taylorbacteria bacterium]
MDIQTLAKEYDALEKRGILEKEIPDFILDNLNQALLIRPYQEKAIKRFLYYFEDDISRTKPAHLLFHMATGSGKTLLMVASILYFYSKGYRNFVFFVDKTNIVRKTIDNFLNPLSTKYLFNNKVVIDRKDVVVQAVENFSQSNPDAINILFTTISGLHSKIQTPQENSVTSASFARRKTVFISDEAHHINAKTRKSDSAKPEDLDALTWEHTVEDLVRSNENNVLLEYTATIEDGVVAILEKYADKIIYEYSLKQFREDKFSKEVYVYQSGAQLEERMLQAVILSQYRRKLAGKHHISLKPVILMKSNRIDQSKANFEMFKKLILGLKKSDLVRLESSISSEDEEQILRKAFRFFKSEGISTEELISEIKVEFSDDKCVEVNTKEQSADKQIMINSLENETNAIRVVFAVNMLNEGWDVLNLFDIVRLYDTRDSRFGIGGKTTISEAQLVGRGARYYPFTLTPDEDKFKRKYDEDLTNELRVLEQLYYHSLTDSRYIAELRKELIKTGITASEDEMRRVTLKLKDDFKMTVFYKNALIFRNTRIKNTREDINDLSIFEIPPSYTFNLVNTNSTGNIFENDIKASDVKTKSVIYKLKDLPKNLTLKALDKIEFYSFSTLQSYLPNLKSTREFISSTKYCGEVDIEFVVKEHNDFTVHSKEVLLVLIEVFESIKARIILGVSEFKGSSEFEYVPLKSVLKDEVVMEIAKTNSSSEQERGIGMGEPQTRIPMELKTKKWYAYDENYGTDQEKYFLTFIDKKVAELKKEFEDVYVIRNEKFVKLYAFKDGQGVEPDFLLYAVSKKNKGALYYQLFVEPKGAHLSAEDGWKQEFLKQIRQNHKIADIFENTEYKIYGLPFFNSEDGMRKEFEKALAKALGA